MQGSDADDSGNTDIQTRAKVDGEGILAESTQLRGTENVQQVPRTAVADGSSHCHCTKQQFAAYSFRNGGQRMLPPYTERAHSNGEKLCRVSEVACKNTSNLSRRHLYPEDYEMFC